MIVAAPNGRRGGGMATAHLAAVGMCDTWATPVQVFDRACEMCGVWPQLDVCATAKTAKCIAWYGPGGLAANGLLKAWRRPWWCNPPYSEAAKWVAKAYDETVRRPDVNGLLLVFSKTDTAWWHTYVEGHAGIVRPHFWRGRIRFMGADGRAGRNTAPYPSVVLHFGRRTGECAWTGRAPRLESFCRGTATGVAAQ